MVINSFSSTRSLAVNGYSVWPDEFTLESYRFLLQGKQMFTSYGITIAVTAIGTVFGLVVTALFAYVLAHPKNRYGGFLSFMTYVPMVFGSGLVGFYLLVVNGASERYAVGACAPLRHESVLRVYLSLVLSLAAV